MSWMAGLRAASLWTGPASFARGWYGLRFVLVFNLPHPINLRHQRSADGRQRLSCCKPAGSFYNASLLLPCKPHLKLDPMTAAVASSLGIVAYLALFVGVGVVFLFVNLLVGHFVRPADPIEEKLEIYECGEPTIGSSFVQFDLRFYVVALLFIIFDVEVAFFFPWATVFGKCTHLMDPDLPVAVAMADGTAELTADARLLYRELGVRNPSAADAVPASLATTIPAGTQDAVTRAEMVAHAGARQLALVTIVDIVVFFAVLMVGFAYVWKRGDLDWVRALNEPDPASRERVTPPTVVSDEPVLSA